MTARGVPNAGRPPGAMALTVKQAAPILGIDERSVRKRVAAGTLYAEHSETGRLLVWVPNAAITAHRQRAAHPGHDPGPLRPESGSGPESSLSDETIAAVVDAVRSELAAVREEWLIAVLAHIGRLERQNAEITGQLVAKDRLITELREQVEWEEARGGPGQQCGAPPAHQADAPPEGAPTTSPASAPAAIAHRRQPRLPRRTLGDRLYNPLVERLRWPESRFDYFLRWVFRDEFP